MKYLFAVLIFFAFSESAARAQDSKALAEIIASSATKVVKGAPFSAQATSESAQILADGNKLTRRSTMRLYRDSEGRFRREGMPKPSVGFGTFSGLDETIFIFDPVANARFLLNPKARTARRTDLLPAGAAKSGSLTVNERKQIELAAMEKAGRPSAAEAETKQLSGSSKEESLGSRKIENLEAEGTRSTQTIPPGAIGNEKALEIVYERWYSKELQLIVFSRHSDPRFGEQIYRLTNISRSEPDRALFSPPPDYKIIAESSTGVRKP